MYDLFMIPQDRLGLRRQRARLCNSAGGQVLEVAIGTGLNIPHYTEASYVVGVDVGPGMLRRAVVRTWESKIPVKLVAADARALPFPDSVFDAVVIALSLCTIPDPDRALEEFARVARPGGQLRFLEHVRSPKPSVASMQDRVSGVWAKVSGGCRTNQDTQSLLDQSPWSVDDLWVSKGGWMIQGTAVKR
jgi:ubiquinone/menaquinone biosynthesis C-methylase UbiE